MRLIPRWLSRKPPAEVVVEPRSPFPTEQDTRSGWRLWLIPYHQGVERPEDHELVEYRYAGSHSSRIGSPRLSPYANASGLYWRPWRGETILGDTDAVGVLLAAEQKEG